MQEMEEKEVEEPHKKITAKDEAAIKKMIKDKKSSFEQVR